MSSAFADDPVLGEEAERPLEKALAGCAPRPVRPLGNCGARISVSFRAESAASRPPARKKCY
jgi:hypothetical protein